MKQFLKENFSLKCMGSVDAPFGCSYKYYRDNENRWYHETANGEYDLILTDATDEAEVIECVEEYLHMLEKEIVFNVSRSVRPVQKKCNGRMIEVIPQEWLETPWDCYYWIYCDVGAGCWYVDEDDMTHNVMLLHADNIDDAIVEAQEYVDYLTEINESEDD